jgi:hypothetical protein
MTPSSRRLETDDFEEWIDDSYRFFMELANWRLPHSFPSALTMCLLFTELICTPVLTDAASAFIMEETPNDTSGATVDTAVDIPCNLQANSANICLSEVEEYLQSLTCPQGCSDTEFHKFMRYSSKFFISNGKLWHRNTHGRHKIVVLEKRRYELLKEVHDILWHKKIYAIQMQLLEQFWGPFLDQDIKWFVQTCHQCQVCKGNPNSIDEQLFSQYIVRGNPN